MAAPASTDEFLDLVRKSQVVEDKKLEGYLSQLGDNAPFEPSKLAGLLVRDGILTTFQAEQLLQGKWKRFTIGKYKVLERLGSGGMGSVYLCEHKLMRRRVAVKVLPTAKAQDEASLQRFYREARAVAALDHPNIVHAYDIDQDESLHFLVMEYVDGASLQDIVRKSGPMDIIRACHYIRQTALGLQHAHQAGLVHRDIKPANIIVDRTGQVKILDMGLARFFHDEDDILTKKFDENVLGTADYLSPEQAEDSHSVDIRADIYSLGATFYYLLTGRAPFGEGSVIQKLRWHQDKNKLPRPVTDFRSEVPGPIVAILNKMLAKLPENRYQIPGEIADALAPYTQTPIAPPSERELPSLSLAATGQPHSHDADTAVTRNEAPRTPTPAPASRTPTPASRPATSPRPTPSPPPAARPLSMSDSGPPLPAATHPGSKSLRVALVLLVFSLFLGSALWLTITLARPSAKESDVKSVPPSDPAAPKILKVGSSSPSAYRYIEKALQYANSNDIIELTEPVHKENLVLKPGTLRSNITIQAAPGNQVLWVAADRNKPLLTIDKLPTGFKLDGLRITMSGKIDENTRLDSIILLRGNVADVAISGLTLQSLGRYGILLSGAYGTLDHPLKLDALTFKQPGKGTISAIYFDQDSDKKKNDVIEISTTCTFEGIAPASQLKARSREVLGDRLTGLTPPELKKK
jgi:serine/threonine protein kinase